MGTGLAGHNARIGTETTPIQQNAEALQRHLKGRPPGGLLLCCALQQRSRQMIGSILAGVVALIHLYIVVLEMVLWDKPAGMKAFGTTPEFAARTKVLAANQGLYNGFLAAGLIWGIWLGEAGDPIKLFFLGCVAVAGLYGAATAGRKILFVQTIPAVIAMVGVWFA
jgi:putative membrane protein